ncbi:unnamed protein product [Musa acuminata var. zebrina]
MSANFRRTNPSKRSYLSCCRNPSLNCYHKIHMQITGSNLPLTLAKGKLYAALVEAITPHSTLRFNPYCRRIFSMIHLKQPCDDDMYYEC